MSDERKLMDGWYHWAGVPVGTLYSKADEMVSEAVKRLEADRDALRDALQNIIEVAKAGDWEGPEIPDPVAAAIAHGQVILRRAIGCYGMGYAEAVNDLRKRDRLK